MEPKKIGRTISEGRAKLGLTLEEVAEKTGTTKQNIKRYETGDFKRPDYQLLNKIFDFLKIEKSLLPVHNGITISKTQELKQVVDKYHPRNKIAINNNDNGSTKTETLEEAYSAREEALILRIKQLEEQNYKLVEKLLGRGDL